MNINLQIIDVGDDGKVYWLKVVALTTEGKVVDRDIFRFPKQTKRILTNPVDDPPDDWKPKLSVPRECNIFSYELLADIATRHFLRRQGLLAGKAWEFTGWTKVAGTDIVLPPEEQRHLPFLANRLTDMLGAKLLVDDPTIPGKLEGVAPKLGTVTSISDDFDGEIQNTGACSDIGGSLQVGLKSGDPDFMRFYTRFSLSSLPAAILVTNVDYKIYVSSLGGSDGAACDVQAYNQDGQANPESDSCATRFTRCADEGSPYIDNSSTLKTTGQKTFELPDEANAHVTAANDAVNRFSLAVNENTATTDDFSSCEATESAGTNEPQIIVTHEPIGGVGGMVV